MDLKRYYGKRVKIIADDKKTYIGTVTDYIYPEDDESEGILIEDDSLEYPIVFTIGEIVSIISI